MAIQKYPYKVTKLEWYDYISRGESNIDFSFLFESDLGFGFSYENGSKLDILICSKQNDDMFPVNIAVAFHSNLTSNPRHMGIVTFNIPSYIPPGLYYVQLKAISVISNKKSVNTVPTNSEELQFTILDTEYPNYNVNVDKKINKNNIKWPEEVTDENV